MKKLAFNIESTLNKKVNNPFFRKYPLLSSVPGCALVLFILCFFEPFRLKYISPFSLKVYIFLLQSTLPFIAHLLIIFFFKKQVIGQEKANFTILKKFCIWSFVIFLCGLVSYMYSYLVYKTLSLEPEMYLTTIYSHIIHVYIISFLVVSLLELFETITLYKNIANKRSFVTKSSKLKIKCENKNGKIYVLNKSSVLLFESNKNHLTIHFLDSNNNVDKITIKKTLKTIEEYFCNKTYGFYRCHKSFIINLDFVIEIQGNSRLGKIALEHNFSIPISRNKVDKLKELILSKG